MYHIIVLGFGYAEEIQLGTIALAHEYGFETKLQLVQDIARVLLDHYCDLSASHDKTLRDCCKLYSGKQHCADCGKKLIREPFDFYYYMDWLRNKLPLFTFDDIGYDLETAGWSVCSTNVLVNADKKDILLLEEMAEKILIKALNPEERDQEEYENFCERMYFTDLAKELELTQYSADTD